jgi:hypothetical protein
LGDFPDGAKGVKKQQMYLRALSEKVAMAEQKHMPLEKLVIEEANSDQRHLLSKKIIREAIEPQKGPLNLKSSFLDSRQMEEEMKDERLDALIKTKRPVQSVSVLLQDQRKRI